MALFENVSMLNLLSDAVEVRTKGEYHIVDMRQATTLLYMLIMFSYNIIEVKFV